MSLNEAAAGTAPVDTSPEHEEQTLEAAGLPTGAEVGSPALPLEEEDEEPALGDHVEITWRQGKTSGTIYYMDETLIRVMPDAASSILVDFAIVDGGFDPDLDVDEESIAFEKGKRIPFVELNGFAPGQMVDAYSSRGDLVKTFEVVSVNATDDKVRLRDIEEGKEVDFSFENRGIDLSEEFAILRVQPLSQPDAALTEEDASFRNSAETFQQVEGVDDPLLAALAAAGGEGIEIQTIGEWKTEVFEKAETLAAQERVYSEFDQKDDMRADLIGMLNGVSQQNPLIRKRIRALVETMSALKQDTIQYNEDGSYEGPKDVSLKTLADVLKDRVVPLARPVLDTKRVLVTEKSEEDTSINGITIKTLDTLVSESTDYLDNLNTYAVAEEGVGLPRFYQTLQTYFSRFPMGDQYDSEGYLFQEDAEYFRRAPPGDEGIPGFASGRDEKTGELRDDRYDGENPVDYVTNIGESLRRAHGPTRVPKPKGGSHILKQGDMAPVSGYVLLPYNTVETGVVGSSRTGQLWQDILRSLPYEKSWMSKLLDGLDGIQTEADAKKAIYVKVDDKTLYEIPFAEYLKLVLRNLIPYGAGDLFAMKKDLGIESSEPDVAQSEVIQQRITEIIAGLVKMVTELNAELEKQVIDPKVNPVLDETVGKGMTEAVFSHPILADIVKKMSQRTPGYKEVDVAVMACLLMYAQDYALVSLGGSNQVGSQRELLKANMRSFLKTMADAHAYKILQESRGAPPEINPCEHVAGMDKIRRIKDDTSRMKGLVKLLKLYKGAREEDWILCNFCQKHLMCQHEVLQLQQFLNPQQHMVLQKEIVLNFAGGTFGANHICKTCGLKIAELGLDTSIEYNDDGKPMMGRSVLIDQDAAALEVISDLFDLPAKSQDELKFDTEDKNAAFTILKILAMRFGIEMDMKVMRKLVEKSASKASQLISETDYKVGKSKGDGRPNYEIYKAYAMVGIVAAVFLLEIQTRKPSYMPRLWLEGCKPGFGGYPLQPDSDPDKPDQAIGIEYLLCGILGIQDTKSPWDLIARIRKAEEKKALLKYHIKEQILNELKNAEVQADINKKREYVRDIYGGTTVGGKHSEEIPKGFLPHVETPLEAGKSGAKEPSISEGAHGSYGETVMADAWLRAVNRLAKETTPYIENTPFIETGCCYSPILSPGLYFKEAALPPLPKRRPIAPGFYRQSILYTPMAPRPLEMFDAKADMSVAFTVFLTTCWRGERTGLSHEFGYDYKCDWCGLQLESKYISPDFTELKFKKGEWEEVISEKKIQEWEATLRVELDRQGVSLTEEGFQDLVNTINRRQIFAPYQVSAPSKITKLLSKIASITPAPVLPPEAAAPAEEDEEDTNTAEYRWGSSIQEMYTKIKSLKDSSSEAEIRVALEPLREATDDAEAALNPVLGKMKGREVTLKELFLTDVLGESQHTILDILRTYFLVPAERIRLQYSQTVLRVPKHYKLKEDHKEQLDKKLQDHTNYLVAFNSLHQKGLRKLRHFADTMSASLNAVEELQVSRLDIPSMTLDGKQLFVREILRAIVVGCLGQLADRSFDPPTEDETGLEGGEDVEDELPADDDRLLQKFVQEMILKYYKERAVYSPAKVREELAKSKELEKNTFIGILDKIQDPEERRTELMFKRLKIKTERHNWNLGATALSYDDVWLENQSVIGKMYATAAELGQGMPGDFGDEFGLDETGYGGGDAETGDGYMDVGAFVDPDDAH